MTANKPLSDIKHTTQKNTADSPCPDTNKTTAKGRSRYSLNRFLKHLLIIASTIIITVILLLSVVIGLIFASETSREWLVQDLLPKLISSDAIQLEIKAFNSPTPGYWYFGSVSLNINQQDIVNANKLLLNIKLAPLLDKKLDITELSAERLLITLPKTNALQEAPDEDNLGSDWQDILIPVRVQKLGLQHIEVKGSDLNLPVFYANGSAELLWQDSLFTSGLSLATKATPATHINLQAKLDTQFAGTLKATIQETPGGWLGKTIKLPNEQEVDFILELSAKADKTFTSWKLDSFNMPWQKHQINAVAHGLWSDSDQKFEISQASIFIDQKEQTIKGWWQDALFDLNAVFNELPIDLASAFQDVIVGGTISGTLSSQGNIAKPKLKTNLQANTQFNKHAMSFSLKGEGDLASFNIEDALVQLGEAKVKTSGAVFIEQQTLDLQVHQLSGPVRIIELFNVEFPDDLYIDINEAQGELKGTFSAPAYSGITQASGRYKEQLFSARTTFIGDIDKVSLTDFIGNTSGSQIMADGLIDWRNSRFDLMLGSKNLPLGLISLLNIELPENLSAHTDTDIQLTGTFTAPEYSGKLSANGNLSKQAFEINSKFKGNERQIELIDFVSHISEGDIQASGVIDWHNEQLNLLLQASNIPSKLASIAQIELPANLSALINTQGLLKGSFNSPSYNGDASVKGAYQETQFDISSSLNSSTDQIELTALSATLLFAEQNKEAQESIIQGNGIYTISSKQLEGKLKVHALPYRAMTLAGMEMPKNLAGIINADLSITGNLPIPIIYGSLNSEGMFERQPFSFNIAGSQKNKALTFDNTKLVWNDTLLIANGHVSKDDLDFHVKLQSLKLTDLNNFGLDLKPGTIDLNFNLKGSLEAPRLDGLIKLTVKNDYQSEDLSKSQEDIVVSSYVKTENENLVLNSEVKQGAESRGNLQIKSHFKPFVNWLINNTSAQRIKELPLVISTKGNVGLNWINHFIDRDTQNISGELTLDAQLEGSLEQPRLKGSLDLINGSYVNALSQTYIKDAEIKLAFDEKSIHIVKADASDGHTGKINLSGKVDLADGDNGLIDITLNAKNASIVRREDIEGDVSGSIKLSGDLKNMQVKGDIDIAPFQIMLNLIPQDSIPEIDVSIKEDSNHVQKGIIKLPYIGLNIDLTVEQQAYIRGRGLDAELKGKMKLTGSINKPSYSGQFNVIRGSFELFAKTFKLEEGDVLFSNDAVSLFVQGRYIGKDLTFIASLSGTLDDLQVELRTEPSLPEDEALARLLFGRSVRNITPFQAVQLASAIQTLRGEGGKFDPLGTARDILHVDNISIESQETTEGNGIAVGLGKYITEGVYVEISRTPEPNQPWKGSVEVELTPNINLETTTGENSGFGGVELQWKKDY